MCCSVLCIRMPWSMCNDDNNDVCIGELHERMCARRFLNWPTLQTHWLRYMQTNKHTHLRVPNECYSLSFADNKPNIQQCKVILSWHRSFWRKEEKKNHRHEYTDTNNILIHTRTLKHTHSENIGKSNDIKRWTKRIFEEKKRPEKRYYKQIDKTKKLTAGGLMILSLYYILRTNEWSLCQRECVCLWIIAVA